MLHLECAADGLIIEGSMLRVGVLDSFDEEISSNLFDEIPIVTEISNRRVLRKLVENVLEPVSRRTPQARLFVVSERVEVGASSLRNGEDCGVDLLFSILHGHTFSLLG